MRVQPEPAAPILSHSQSSLFARTHFAAVSSTPDASATAPSSSSSAVLVNPALPFSQPPRLPAPPSALPGAAPPWLAASATSTPPPAPAPMGMAMGMGMGLGVAPNLAMRPPALGFAAPPPPPPSAFGGPPLPYAARPPPLPLTAVSPNAASAPAPVPVPAPVGAVAPVPAPPAAGGAGLVDGVIKIQMDRARAKLNELKFSPPPSAPQALTPDAALAVGAGVLPPQPPLPMATAPVTDAAELERMRMRLLLEEQKANLLRQLEAARAAAAPTAAPPNPAPPQPTELAKALEALAPAVASAVPSAAPASAPVPAPTALEPILQTLTQSLQATGGKPTAPPTPTPLSSPVAATATTPRATPPAAPTPTSATGRRRVVSMGGAMSLMDLQRKRTGEAAPVPPTPSSAAAAAAAAASTAASTSSAMPSVVSPSAASATSTPSLPSASPLPSSRVISSNQYVSLVHMSDPNVAAAVAPTATAGLNISVPSLSVSAPGAQASPVVPVAVPSPLAAAVPSPHPLFTPRPSALLQAQASELERQKRDEVTLFV